jgi:hypothetical protein
MPQINLLCPGDKGPNDRAVEIKKTNSFTVDDAKKEGTNICNSPVKIMKESNQISGSHLSSLAYSNRMSNYDPRDEVLLSPNILSELDNSIILKHAYSNHSKFVDSNYGYDPQDF